MQVKIKHKVSSCCWVHSLHMNREKATAIKKQKEKKWFHQESSNRWARQTLEQKVNEQDKPENKNVNRHRNPRTNLRVHKHEKPREQIKTKRVVLHELSKTV